MTNSLQEAGEAVSGTGEAAAAAPFDLQTLLQQIAERIHQSDRRQNEMFSEMQQRLAVLGSDARNTRPRVPVELAPAFERVEESMALLAERISGAVGNRAPALRPALFAGPEAGTDAEAQGQPGDGQWDPDQAEALTRVYEASGLSGDMSEPTRSLPGLHVPYQPARSLAAEQAWLEQKFAGIAERLEQSLADIRPDNAIVALGQRIETFEKRFSQALSAVGPGADHDSLRHVESQLNELAASIEDAQSKLNRVDALEGQLLAIVERLSDERLTKLIERGAKPVDVHAVAEAAAERAAQRVSRVEPSIDDIERIIASAAEEIAERLAKSGGQQPNPDSSRMQHLQDMLESFIGERRLGEETTATMLDTMQQAMIRILDRIDAIEMNQHHVGMPAAPSLPVERDNIRYSERPGDTSALLDVGNFDVEAEMAAAAAEQPQHSRAPQPAPKAAPALAQAPLSYAPEFAEASPAPQSRAVRPAIEPEPAKEDFIAAARRARRQAAAAAEVHQAEGADAAPSLSSSASRKDAPRASATAADAPLSRKEAVASFFGLSRKAIIGGIVAVLTVMAASLAIQPRSIDRLASQEGATHSIAEAPAVTREGRPASLEQRLGDNRLAAAEIQPGASRQDAADPAHDPQYAALAQGGATTDAGSDSATAPQGIVLEESPVIPTGPELERLNQRQHLANMSAEIGSIAARSTPASLMVERNAGQPAAPVSAIPDQAGRTALDLPPATVGPMSLRLAAAQGDPSAQFEVGARLAEGKGTEQNFVEAIRWYQRSAQQGFAQAQYRLGTLYERGLGVKADLGHARAWYKRAADQGNVKAMHNLAVLLAGRSSAKPDYAAAAKLFTDASERGLVDSQYNLAVLYESGLGVPKDLKQAFKWFSIAARNGDKDTVKRREQLRAQLPLNELNAAEREATSWSARPLDLVVNDPRAAGEAWKQRAAEVSG